MSDFCVICVTCANKKEAHRIAERLVSRRLAACVNILSDVGSIYWWEGRVERSREVMLLNNSQAKRFNAVCKEVKKNHSYTCPEVISIPILQGSKPYLDWIRENTRS